MEAVRDWYVKHLGLTILMESPDFVLLGSQGAHLGLHRGEPLSEPERINLHFEVVDVDIEVDIEYERIKRRGLIFAQAPKTMPWGYRTAYLRDPAGHTVEIYTAPKQGH